MAERSFFEEIKKPRLGEEEVFRGGVILAVTKALQESGETYVGGPQGLSISHPMGVIADAQDVLTEHGIRFENSASEATSAAMLAASVNYPLREATTFKATADTTLTSGGVTGGGLIIVGEDFGEGSSIVQERSHAFAMKSQMWLLGPRPNLPCIAQSVKDGFDLSEASNTPAILQMRIRLCHLHGHFVSGPNRRRALTVKDALETPARARQYPTDFPSSAIEGISLLVDYQDTEYDRLDALATSPGGNDTELLRETERHLALWSSYEDTVRVADLKTRGTRFDRVRSEGYSRSNQVLAIEEFMHPRLEEICETLPAGLVRWLAPLHWTHRMVGRFTRHGRIIRTSSFGGLSHVNSLGSWHRWRRVKLRYALETERIETWLQRVGALAAIDPVLALETAQCQRLVKGYSDTHARGLRNYETLMPVADRHAQTLAPATLRQYAPPPRRMSTATSCASACSDTR